MHEVVNTGQFSAWNGAEGAHWADHHDRWNAVNEGFNGPLLAAAGIEAGSRVLDIGCGAGQTSRLAARTAREGHVLGLDLSGPMLARARALAAAEGLENVAFEQGDAQAHPLPEAAFDAAVSRFGIMFFADPSAAFRHVGRALRPGGRLAFVCMADPGRNDWAQVFAGLAAHVPGPGPDFSPGAPGMFSLADPARIEDVLTGAGFRSVRAGETAAQGRWGDDAEDATRFLCESGPGRAALEAAGPAAGRARTALADALRRYERPGGGVWMRSTAWLVTAERA
ncbi:class I SAM-dependent methyltransferase [Streptomyces sclerotialus]|uniref:class I SAM-dependent methyltransferase n=1 Tax=Streptomyces sclerotialus TaxID=1957 RepID=UPI0004C5E979